MYLNKITPFLSFFLTPITYFVYLKLKKNKIKFIVNTISQSTGHVLMELDWFFRYTKIHKEDDFKYGIVWPKSEVSIGARDIYKHKFNFFIVNNFIFRIVSLVLIRYPDITIDFSLSHLNYISQLDKKKKFSFYYNKFFLKKKLHKEKADVINNYIKYYKAIQSTKNYFPMSFFSNFDDKLKNFIGKEINNYAIIHIKNVKMNATLKETDPNTYIKTIKYLQQKGFKVIFAGREKMPKLFDNLNILNYSEWKYASFEFDLQLLKNSKFILAGASGFGYFADIMNIPSVYSNFWQIGIQNPGQKTILIPTLLKKKETSNFISFQQQSDLFYNFGWVLDNLKDYEPRNASEDEVYDATIEALSFKNENSPMNEEQINFNNINKKCPSCYALSRLSKYFAKKHINLF